MIIQVRGTSGSGKTTAVRAVVEAFGGFETFQPHYRRSKSPVYYVNDRYNLAIIGSYENLCGGADRTQAMGGYALLQDLVREVETYNILMEGLLLSEDTKQTLSFPNCLERLRVLFLTTNNRCCIDRVNERRRLHNRSKPLNTDILEGRIRTIERARLKLIEAGVYCRRCSSNQAPGIITRWLREAENALNL